MSIDQQIRKDMKDIKKDDDGYFDFEGEFQDFFIAKLENNMFKTDYLIHLILNYLSWF